MHVATGVVLLAGAPRRLAARVMCLACSATYAVVAVVDWIDVVPIVLALAMLAAAAAPRARPTAVARRNIAGDPNERVSITTS